jgi:hypothetical protein
MAQYEATRHHTSPSEVLLDQVYVQNQLRKDTFNAILEMINSNGCHILNAIFLVP